MRKSFTKHTWRLKSFSKKYFTNRLHEKAKSKENRLRVIYHTRPTSMYLVQPLVLLLWNPRCHIARCSILSSFWIQVQRALQVRIEEHARYLQKILEEQQKAQIAVVSSQSLSSVTCEEPEVERCPESLPNKLTESKSNPSSPLPSKHTSEDSESQPCLKRPRLEDEAKHDRPLDVPPVHNSLWLKYVDQTRIKYWYAFKCLICTILCNISMISHKMKWSFHTYITMLRIWI